MPPLLVTLASHPLFLQVAQSTNGFTRGEILGMLGVGLGFVYWVANRVNVVRDRNHAKREAMREQAVKERTEKIKKLEASVAEQQAKNTGYQQQIEQIGGQLMTVQSELKGALEISRDNKQKIENVKESLARIEAQLATLLGSLLNRP